MGTRIEVAIRPDLPDPRGNRFLKRIQDDLGIRVASIRILDVYNVDKPLDVDQQERCRRELFTDPLTEHSSLGPLPDKAFDWMIEIGFLPGVTDNVGNTSREAIEDLLNIVFRAGESVYSAEQILLVGSLSGEQVKRIASIRYNPLIQRAGIQSRAEWEADPMDRRIYVPKVDLTPDLRVGTVSLNVDDAELSRLGKEGILDRVEELLGSPGAVSRG